MTDVGETRPPRVQRKDDKGGNAISRLFGRLGRFISEILDELRKVVRPTRSELWQYTLVVIVFVTVVMALVSGIDYGFTKLVGLVFGTS